jgi:hypothetical protein
VFRLPVAPVLEIWPMPRPAGGERGARPGLRALDRRLARARRRSQGRHRQHHHSAAVQPRWRWRDRAGKHTYSEKPMAPNGHRPAMLTRRSGRREDQIGFNYLKNP